MATFLDVVRRRLWTQGLMQPRFARPADAVAWLGAMQAQDYFGAMWALGQRVADLTAEAGDRAFDAGEILRTHVLRPTWHFVTPADIRWILALSAPRVHQFNGFMYRSVGLDRATLLKSRRVIERALARDRFLTRTELAAALARAKIEAARMHLAYLMMYAELEGAIISGPRRGNQFTYALLDDRAPAGKTMAPDAALATLTLRYITAHGPATVRDFAWWSGLTMGDAKRGVSMIAADVETLNVDGLTYWASRSAPPAPRARRSAFLLPNYDECLIAYKDRGAPAGTSTSLLNTTGTPHHLMIDGRIAGAWGRRLQPRRASIDIAPYAPLSKADTTAVEREAVRYGRFLNLPVEVTIRN